MQIARSFDINRPGARPSQLKGGIIGGSIIQGTFSVDDEVIIAPGRRITKGSKQSWEPIETKIISMKGGGKDLREMHAGGLCGIATPLDPTMTKADNLTGQVMARKGELPPVWDSLNLDLTLLERMVAGDEGSADIVKPLALGEMLMINASTATSVGTVTKVSKGKTTLTLRLPICADVASRVTLSRRVDSRWRLIGHGTISG